MEGDTESSIDEWGGGGGGDEQKGEMINMKKEKKFKERREDKYGGLEVSNKMRRLQHNISHECIMLLAIITITEWLPQMDTVHIYLANSQSDECNFVL